jgi:hypothetical protein
MNAVEIGGIYDVLKEAGFHFFETDMKNFDSTQGIGCAAASVAFHTSISGELGPDASNFLRARLESRGQGRYHRYSTVATRRSGDPQTSCDNGDLNFIAHDYCLRRLGIPFSDVYTVVMGDDNVTAVRRNHDIYAIVAALPAIMAELGFQSEPLIQDPVSFCSAYFIPMEVDGVRTHVLTPDIRRIMSKLGFGLDNRTPSKAFHEKAASVLSLAPIHCIPIGRGLTAGLRSQLRGTDADIAAMAVHDEPWRANYTVGGHILTACPDTWPVYSRLLDITMAEAMELDTVVEHYVRLVGAQVAIVNHPLIASLAQRWLGRPCPHRLSSPPLPEKMLLR